MFVFFKKLLLIKFFLIIKSTTFVLTARHLLISEEIIKDFAVYNSLLILFILVFNCGFKLQIR